MKRIQNHKEENFHTLLGHLESPSESTIYTLLDLYTSVH